MSYTDYLEKELSDHLFGKGTYNPPTLAIGLSTTAIADAGTGETEPDTAAGYDRIVCSGGTFNAASGTTATIQNAVEIAFAQADSNWGTITHFFVADSISDGNILMSNSLQQSKAINQGDTARFSAGDLTHTLD